MEQKGDEMLCRGMAISSTALLSRGTEKRSEAQRREQTGKGKEWIRMQTQRQRNAFRRKEGPRNEMKSNGNELRPSSDGFEQQRAAKARY